MSELKYWLWLATLKGLRVLTCHRLLEQFGAPEQIFFADDTAYKTVEGITEKEIACLQDKSLVRARTVLADCQEQGFQILTVDDSGYPDRLRHIFDPPVVLYVRGTLPVLDEEAAVAIVGTRKCTPYGVITAERIAYTFAKAGGLVVTGLARGIDTAATRGALRAGGRVIGVVASGLDIVYPPEHGRLFDDVAATGAIVSEYPPGTQVERYHFPARNRIMSGLSLGSLVIEAPKMSGALITAAKALEQGRDVFAVPGNVESEASEGSNQLLRDGAIVVTSGFDLVEEYLAQYPEKLVMPSRKNLVRLDAREQNKLVEQEQQETKKTQKTAKEVIDNRKQEEYIDFVPYPADASAQERSILSLFDDAPIHIDDIIARSGLDASVVSATMTLLEIRGCVQRLPGGLFQSRIKK